jgi:hypothetical protein
MYTDVVILTLSLWNQRGFHEAEHVSHSPNILTYAPHVDMPDSLSPFPFWEYPFNLFSSRDDNMEDWIRRISMN